MIHPRFRKVIIYYFSGTGNAKNTALWIGEESRQQGIETEIINIGDIKFGMAPTPPENTLVGFISPTHGFHFPQIMRSFIKYFPTVKKCSAFVINTRAGLRIGKLCLPGLSGMLHYWSAIVLKRKGFTVSGLFPVDLPSNWLLLHPAVRKRGVDIMYGHVEPKVRDFAKGMIHGERKYRAFLDIVQDMLISPVSIGYLIIGKYVFAKSFIASGDCDCCGLCEKTCPVNAIKRIDGRMFWTASCESCMKCMNVCPRKAIETAHGFVSIIVILYLLLFNYVIDQLVFLFNTDILYWLHKWYIKLIIATLLFYPVLVIGYRIMHWLTRFRSFERIFVLSSLSSFTFWGRYNSLERLKRMDKKQL